MKSPRVFYGWWIVGACFLISFYIGGVIIYGFTAIFEPMVDEFGWSYTQISFAASLRGLETGLLSPIMGILVDRWGPRRLLLGGAIFVGLGLMLVSRTVSIGMFYSAFALVGIGMSACVSTVLMPAVANWFRSKVSIATGIMMCGFGFSGLLVPVIVRLIDIYGWRMAMVILALGMFAIVLPLSLIVRHKPEQYGYVVDGEVNSPAISHKKNLAPPETVEVHIGAKQALKSTTFWHIAVALMCQSMVLNAVVTHVMPYLSSIGITRRTSSLVASAIPLLSVGGRLGFGWLGDKLDKRQVTAGAFGAMTLGLICFGYTGNGWAWLLMSFLILFGIGYGGNNTMRAALLSEYFGRSNFGTINGFTGGVMILGSIAGAPLAGWAFDNWGSYQGIWLVFAGLAVVALILVASIRPIYVGHDSS